jgi:hypothetical protein
MRQFEYSKAEVAKWRWPTQYVTPACRCSDHDYPHVHRPFELWNAQPIKPGDSKSTYEGEEEMKLYSNERELVSEGDHLVEFSKFIDEGEEEDRKGTTKHYIRYNFLVLDEENGNGKLKMISDRFVVSFHSKAKLYSAVVATLGEEPGQGFESDHLLKQQVVVTIKHNDTDKGRFDNIVGYKRAPGNHGDGDLPAPVQNDPAPPASQEPAKAASPNNAFAQAKQEARERKAAAADPEIRDEDIPF